MAPARVPNSALIRIMEEAQVGNGELARAVCRLGLERGYDFTYGAPSITHWRSGIRPRKEVVPVLCEALGRRLGRRLRPEDVGLSSEESTESEDLGLSVGDPLATLREMGKAAIERRSFLVNSAYSIAGAALPLGTQQAAEYADRAQSAAEGAIIGQPDVSAVHDMVRTFTAMDERHGGQHARSAVTQYLNDDVMTMCRGRFESEAVQKSMWCAAASLAYLVGWKSHDAGESGMAQRFYLQAYGLTRNAGDLPHSAFVLRILAHHAMDAERPEYVMDLAEEAVRRATGRVDTATQSLFVICRARALGATGKRRESIAEAIRARDMAGTSTPADLTGWAAMWGAAPGTVSSHTAKLLAQNGDFAAAEQHYTTAANRYAGAHTRITGLSLASKGRMQCAQGHVEGACETWTTALEALSGVKSSRAVDAVKDMRSSVATFRARGARVADELHERTGVWLNRHAA